MAYSGYIYASAMQKLGGRAFDFTGDSWWAYLMGPDYAPNWTAHQDVTDLPAGDTVASAELASLTYNTGVWDAADTVFATAKSGSAISQVVFVHGSGASALVLWNGSGSGLPMTANGNAITATWPAAGIWNLINSAV